MAEKKSKMYNNNFNLFMATSGHLRNTSKQQAKLEAYPVVIVSTISI